MNVVVDPYAYALFQNIGNATASVGGGILGQYYADKMSKAETEAVLAWLRDPTPEKFAAASKHGGFERLLQGMQQLANIEKTEAETRKTDAQTTESALRFEGIQALSNALGISPGLAELLYQKPELFELLGGPGQDKPLAHLEQEERAQYFADENKIRDDIRAAELAFRLGTTGDASYLDELHALRPVHEDRLKKLRGNSDKSRDHGRNEVKNILSEMAQKRVLTHLYSLPHLTAKQRRALETTILSSQEYQELVRSVSDELLNTPDEFAPAVLLEAIDKFVDKYAGTDDVMTDEMYGKLPADHPYRRQAEATGAHNVQPSWHMAPPSYQEVVRGVPKENLVSKEEEEKKPAEKAPEAQAPETKQEEKEYKSKPLQGPKPKEKARLEAPKGMEGEEARQPREPLKDQLIKEPKGQLPKDLKPKADDVIGEAVEAETKEKLIREPKAKVPAQVEFAKPQEAQPQESQTQEPQAPSAQGVIRDAVRQEQQQSKPAPQSETLDEQDKKLAQLERKKQEAKSQEQQPREQRLPGPGELSPPLAPAEALETQAGQQKGKGYGQSLWRDAEERQLDLEKEREKGSRGKFVEKQEIEKEVDPESIGSSPRNFAKWVRSKEHLKDTSDEDIAKAYKNHRAVVKMVTNLRRTDYDRSGDYSGEAEFYDPDFYARMERLLEGKYSPDMPLNEKTAVMRRAHRQAALEAALTEDMFLNGVPYDVAEQTAKDSFATMDPELRDLFLDEVDHREKFSLAVEAILADTPFDMAQEMGLEVSPEIAQRIAPPGSIVQLPEDLSDDLANQIIDSMAVGGVRGVVRMGDSLIHGGLIIGAGAAAGVTTGIGWIGTTFIAKGIFHTADLYLDTRLAERSRYYQAFFLDPRSNTQRQKNVATRREFAEKYSEYFTVDERRAIINGTYEDLGKVKYLINMESLGDTIADFVASPVGALDRRTINAVAWAENEFPNYNESFVRGVELFGDLTGAGLAGKVIGKAFAKAPKIGKGKQISGPKVIEAGPATRSRLVQARAKTIEAISKALPGKAKTLFDKTMKQWADTSGNITYKPYTQNKGFFSLSNALVRRGVLSAGYGAMDYWLDEFMDDSQHARMGLRFLASSIGHVFENYYYQGRQKAFDINSKYQQQQFTKFGEDFGGGVVVRRPSPAPKGSPGGAFVPLPKGSIVVDAPHIGKEIIVKPGGIMEVRPSPTAPENLPEGPVTRKEFLDTQSDNLISIQGLSKNLGIDAPDFTRSEATSVVDVDVDALQEYVQDAWYKKARIIETARQKDLAPLTGLKEVPKTNDLKKLATKQYAEVERILGNVDRKELVNNINKEIDTIDAYFQVNPTLGGQSVQKLANDVRQTLAHEDFDTSRLLDYHQKINKERRALAKALDKEYSPEKAQLLRFYTALDHAIRTAIPEEAKGALDHADNLYRAYKHSEAIDDLMKYSKIENMANWLTGGKIMNTVGDDIYSSLRNSNSANALRKSFLHDDYIRGAMVRPNVAWSRNGEVFRNGDAIESQQELENAFNALQRAMPFGKAGALARAGTYLTRRGGKLGTLERGREAVKSTEAYQAPEYKELVNASSKAHDLREIEAPTGRSKDEHSDVIEDIEKFKAKRKQRVVEKRNQDYQASIDEKGKTLARRAQQLMEFIEGEKGNVKAQGQHIKELLEVIELMRQKGVGYSDKVQATIENVRKQAQEFYAEHSQDITKRLKEYNKAKPASGATGMYPRRSLSDDVRNMQQGQAPKALQDAFEQSASHYQYELSPESTLRDLTGRVQQLQNALEAQPTLEAKAKLYNEFVRTDEAFKALAKQWGGRDRNPLLEQYRNFHKLLKRIEEETRRATRR